MKSFFTTIVTISVLLFVITPFALPALATTCEGIDCVTKGLEVTAGKAQLDTGQNAANLPRIIGRAINYLFGVIGVIALTVVLIGGFEWLTSGGNEEKIGKAKKWIINGINGLIVIFMSYALVYTIMTALGDAIAK